MARCVGFRLPLALLLSGSLSCSSSGFPPVLDATDIIDLREGRPQIDRIRDLGNVHIGGAGPLAGESDGRLTIGELLLIEGSGFGKQPTVRVGERPLEVLFRTKGGGIIGRLPTGIAPGTQSLSVEAGGKRTDQLIEVKRLALLLSLSRGELHAVEIDGGLVRAPEARPFGKGPVLIPQARSICIADSGSVAYVLSSFAQASRLSIVDLGAPSGPKVSDTRDLTHAAYGVVCAERAPLFAVVGSEYVSVFDSREPRRPAPYRPAHLPEEARGASVCTLDATGGLLALGKKDENRVLLVDIKPGAQKVDPHFLGQVEVLPNVRQQQLTHLRFAPDGETIWALTGDNKTSFKAGHQPTRLIAVHVGAAEGSVEIGERRRDLAIEKTMDIKEAPAPVHLALARVLPTASGATIRTPPDKTGLYFTGVVPEVLDGGAGSSMLTRVQGTGEHRILHQGDERLGGVDLTPDGAIAVAAVLSVGPQGFGVLLAHTEKDATLSVSLGAATDKDRKAPFPSVAVAVQP